MKSIRRIFCITLTACLVSAIPMNALAATNYDGQQIYDYFAEEVTEYISLDGVSYRIDYSYQEDLRVIIITNCTTAQENILTYSPHSDEMLLNDAPITDFSGSYAPQTDGEWTLVSSETYTITWGAATGVAGALVVAGAIAAKVPALGIWGAILAIGLDVLGVIAGACAGATLHVNFYTLTFPFQPIQYMYEWTFTPWTGDATYGPFRIVMDNQVASIGDSHELQ